jgi:hypothetical protein
MNNYSDSGNYEVGYGRPPISGTFKAGVSGNPSGRPKLPSDFGAKVVRELNTKLIITENGNRKVITKDDGLAKQTVNKALSGNFQAMRLAIDLRQQEREKVAEEQRLSPINLAGVDVRDLTTEELFALLQPGLEESIKAKLEKSLRVELRKSIKAELEQSIRADLEKSIRRELEKSIGADANGRKRDSRSKSTSE